MGNSFKDRQGFSTKDWLEVSQNSNSVTIWQNKTNSNFHIEEHKIYTIDSNEMNQELDLYYRRKNHSRWVAALYFRQKSSQEFCVSRSVAHIFLQKIPIRINDLKELPNPDAIHTYDQCLHGYAQFANLVGFFRVHPQFIGVNEKGVVKVWAGQKWAQVGIIGDKVNEQEMVRSIVDSIDQSILRESQVFSNDSIKNYLYRRVDTLTFHQAIKQLREYANQTNKGAIPNRLQSLYLHKRFDQFMDPLLRSIHNPYESQSQKLNYVQQPKHQSLTTFRKVEQKEKQPQGYIANIKQPPRIKEEPLRQSGGSYNERVQNQVRSTRLIKSNSNSQNVMISRPVQNHLVRNRQPELINSYRPLTETQRAGINMKVQPRFNNGQHRSNISSPLRAPPRANSPRYRQPTHAPQINFKAQGRQQSTIPTYLSQNQVRPQPYRAPEPVYRPQSMATFQKKIQPPSQQQMFKPKQEQPRKRPMPESIIMNLYNSEDNFLDNKADPPIKSFGNVKRTQSIREVPLQGGVGSSTLINKGSNPLLGIPQYQGMSTNANLQSIQELHSEHYKYEHSSPSSHNRLNSDLNPPSQTVYKPANPVLFQSSSRYNAMDPNDGKSSQEMMQFLQSFAPKR